MVDERTPCYLVEEWKSKKLVMEAWIRASYQGSALSEYIRIHSPNVGNRVVVWECIGHPSIGFSVPQGSRAKIRHTVRKMDLEDDQ